MIERDTVKSEYRHVDELIELFIDFFRSSLVEFFVYGVYRHDTDRGNC